MSEHIEVLGEVKESCRGIFSVKVDDTPDDQDPIKCKLSGKMRKFRINVVPGDRVKVKVSPYDLTNGIIVQRL